MNSAISVQLALTSGEVTSGYIGDASVNSGNIASGVASFSTPSFAFLNSGVNNHADMVVASGARMRTDLGGIFGQTVIGASGYYSLKSGSSFASGGGGGFQSGQPIPFNVVIGDANTGVSLTDYAQANVLIGEGAGRSLSNNVSSGGNPLFVGRNNVAIGFKAMYNLFAGGDNVAIGVEALFNCVGGTQNIAVGFTALFNCTGDGNTALGFGAAVNFFGNNGVFIGTGAGRNTSNGDNSIFIGQNADSTSSSVAGDIVSIGNNCFAFDGGVTIGAFAGSTNASGANVILIGSCITSSADGAGASLTTGSDDIFIGTTAGHLVDTGSNNILIGSLAGQFIQTGSGNVFIGAFTGQSATAGTEHHSVLIGDNADIGTTGNNNLVGIGSGVKAGIQTVVIGVNSDGTSCDNSVLIGNNITGHSNPGPTFATNSVIIASTAPTSGTANDLLIQSGDTGLRRIAPAVVGVIDGTANPGWTMNRAGNIFLDGDYSVTGAPAAISAGATLSWNIQSGRSYTFNMTFLVDIGAGATLTIDFNGSTATIGAFSASYVVQPTTGADSLLVTSIATAFNVAGGVGYTQITIIGYTSGTGSNGTFYPEVSVAGGVATILAGSHGWVFDTDQ